MLCSPVWPSSFINISIRPNSSTSNSPGGDVNEVSCSPDDFALVAAAVSDSKPAWEAKPKPAIDLSPSTMPSSSGFLKFESHTDGRDRSATRNAVSLGRDWTKPLRLFRICVGYLPGDRYQLRESERSQPVCALRAGTGGRAVKFGTLVFFSGLKHVGVVADERGFYHACRHGVIYSEFNEYWLKRIDGFRRVPLTIHVSDY